MVSEAVLALIMDLLVGDPPNTWHPVAWIGRYLAAWQRRMPRGGPHAQLAWGAAALGSGLALMGLLARGLSRWLARAPSVVRLVVRAWLFKLTFSVRGLSRAAREVQCALQRGDLPAARRALAWHLVSRPTRDLSASFIAAAAIESVAENTSDSVVAPALYYALGGLPAAWAYRFVNTADAMWGYRDPARAYLGKIPARLDDALNVLPARGTAGLMVLAAAVVGDDAAAAWRVWRRDAGRTASPNAGHPMAAAAGALGVTLEKVGHYRLHAEGRAPTANDIGRAVRLLYAVTGLAWALLLLVRWRGARS